MGKKLKIKIPRWSFEIHPFNTSASITMAAMMMIYELYKNIKPLHDECATNSVYSCHERKNGKKCVIKMISRYNDKKHGNEHKILNKINHKFIIKLLSTTIMEDTCFLVFPYYEGTLLNFMDIYKLTEELIVKIFVQLIEAVLYLHTNNIVHRDIKLENVLFTRPSGKIDDVEVRLTDFGFAKSLNYKNKEKTKNTRGTLHYVAPEILRDFPNGHPVDIWALGVVLYTLLFGTLPFSGEDHEQTKGNILRKRFSHPLKELSQKTRFLMEWMLESDQDKRIVAENILKFF